MRSPVLLSLIGIVLLALVVVWWTRRARLSLDASLGTRERPRRLSSSSEDEDEQEVELQEELELVRAYLEIEQTRLDERIDVWWEIEPATLDARVPRFILQPVVENAIEYRATPRVMPGVIEIAAWVEGSRVRIRVRDNGGEVPSDHFADRLALRATRDRLRAFYGDACALERATIPGQGNETTISLPSHR